MNQKRWIATMRISPRRRLLLCLALASTWLIPPLLGEIADGKPQALTSEVLLGALRDARIDSGDARGRLEESRLQRSTDLFTKLQAAIQLEHGAGKITSEQAASRLVGGFSELGFLMEDSGQYNAAMEVFRGALPLVEGTLQEIEMLKNIARCAEWSGDPATALLAYQAVAEHPLFLQVEDELVAAHEYVVWKLLGEGESEIESPAAARFAVARLVDRILESGEPELLKAAQDRLDAVSWEERPWLAGLVRSLETRGYQLRRSGGESKSLDQAAGAGVESRWSASEDLVEDLGENFEALLARGGLAAR